ncbi:MAG: flagellar hook protein FlgE [Xanthomonadales bacterium]|nr:flagellar hook protein FlgE [Xanthomonadales bacterium]
MPFNIALSGINAASADLNTTAHNISNANTTGFKQSRTEFADVYAAGAFGLSSVNQGSGVRVAAVSQQFTQGTINFTENPLDLAINGEGFFTVSQGGETGYTRARSFQLDRDGYVVTASGQNLQVFPPVGTGGFATGGLESLQLGSTENPPQASGELVVGVNLPANADVPAITPLDPADPDSYNHTTSMTVYDSLGAAHTASFFYTKDAAANTWNVQAYVDGAAVGNAQQIAYDTSGQLVTPAGGALTLPAHPVNTGAADLNLTVDVGETSQYGESFAVNNLSQDGYTTGRLSGLEVTDEGIVQARFTNGQATPLGQLAIANFNNVQGLQAQGDNFWTATYGSGEARLGVAGSSDLGLVQSGALEGSNVDLTEQLVKMITAQRSFQANAQTISAADTITQTIINI